MSFSLNLPSIRPALNLNFARSRALDPRVTFARTSTASYYDGRTLAKAEENLLIRSQEFNNAVWTASRLTVAADSTTAPDGTTTADTITNTIETGGHAINQASVSAGYSIVSGLIYVISVFAKKSTADFFQIATFNASNTLGTGRANFDLATGVVGSVDGGTSTITDVGNGWYRCTYIVTASASGSVNIYFGIVTTSTAIRFESYTGLGTEAVFLWGAQLEQRGSVTAYTPTTTQPITNYVPQLLTAAANTPRFDHAPVTGDSLGLLIEEQRSNLLERSEEFDNAYWTKLNSAIISNTLIAPDGTLTADKLVDDTATAFHLVERQLTLTVSTTYSLSVYVKAAELTHVRVYGRSSANWTVLPAGIFNLSNGTVESSTGSASATIQHVGNGWYRCTIFGVPSNSNVGMGVNTVQGTSQSSYTGTGLSGVYIWGAQVEAGAFPTSYIPTVAATVTRIADSASMTGTNFSSWYNQSAGTLYGEAAPLFAPLPSPGRPLFLLRNLAGTSFVDLRYRPSQKTGAAIVTSNVAQVDTSSAANYTTAAGKISAAYATNDVASTFNAEAVQTDTSATLPTDIAVAYFGSDTSNWFNGHIRRISYYSVRLSNAELQNLTK